MSAQPLRGLVIIHFTVTRYERSQITLRARLLNALTTLPVYTYLDQNEQYLIIWSCALSWPGGKLRPGVGLISFGLINVV